MGDQSKAWHVEESAGHLIHAVTWAAALATAPQYPRQACEAARNLGSYLVHALSHACKAAGEGGASEDVVGSLEVMCSSTALICALVERRMMSHLVSSVEEAVKVLRQRGAPHTRAEATRGWLTAFSGAIGNAVKEAKYEAWSLEVADAVAASFALCPSGSWMCEFGGEVDMEHARLRICAGMVGMPTSRSAQIGQQAYSLAVAPDGSSFAVGTTGRNRLFVFDALTMALVLETSACSKGWIGAVDYAPDSKTLCAGNQDGQVVFWCVYAYLPPVLHFGSKRPGSSFRSAHESF